MTDSMYVQLLRDFCKINAVPAPELLLEYGHLYLNQRVLLLKKVEFNGVDYLDTMVDLEAFDAGNKMAVYESMLATNLILGALGGGRLALDPTDNAKPVFFERICLKEAMTAQDLTHLLVAFLGQVECWEKLAMTPE